MTLLTYQDILHASFDRSVADDLISSFDHEICDVVAAFAAGEYQLVEPWPTGRGPAGPLTMPDGSLAHGSYARAAADETSIDLVVCNNGWPIEVANCPGPLPPALTTNNPNNLWLASQGSLVMAGDLMIAFDGDHLGIWEVIERRKPLALSDTDDRQEAAVFKARAEASGLAVHVQEWHDPCCGKPAWFVEVARTEAFDELIDLDAVCAWYEMAIGRTGLSDDAEHLISAVADLSGRSPAEFLGNSGPLLWVPSEDQDPQGTPSSVAGLVLGYWPPTTAAIHLSQWFADRCPVRYDQRPLTGWSQVRWNVAAPGV